MDIQTTFEIDGHIIECGFRYSEYIDDASGIDVLCQQLDHDQTNIISVVDTESDILYTDNFKSNHYNLVDKWLESNDPIEDGIG